MSPKEIREFSPGEIQKKLSEVRGEWINLHVRKQSGQIEKSSRLSVLRRDIARMETILTEKNRATAAAK